MVAPGSSPYCSNVMAISSTRSLDVEIRIQDYLNDKLQTAADLDNLDSLLQNIQHQHELLRVQVRLRTVPFRIFLADETEAR